MAHANDNDRMAERRNGGMAEWQNGRMAEWQNGRMADGMVKWWEWREWWNGKKNGRMAEWQKMDT